VQENAIFKIIIIAHEKPGGIKIMKISVNAHRNLVFLISLFFILMPTIAKSQTGIIAFSNTPPDDNNEIYIINADQTGLQQITNRPGRDAGPSWSPDAEQIVFYTHYDNQNTWSIFKMKANGDSIVRLTNTQGVYDSSPHWSPNEPKIIFSREYPPNFNAEIWIMDTDGTNLVRIVEDGLGGEWSPDGSQIVYASEQDGDFEIYVINNNGSGLLKLTDNNAKELWPSWSSDGEWIVFQSDRDNDMEIYKMKKNGSEQTRLTYSPGLDANGDWSPDGNYIAFVSERDGNYEIYIMDTGGGNQTRITNNLPVHNIQPEWRPITGTGMDDNQTDSFVPKSFELFQNFPNPFNPTTKIRFSVASRSFVSLGVYDVLGNEIKSLVNEKKPVGIYEIEFDGTALSSGIYYCQLRSGGLVQTKKMILLK
jgi:dipeptidyl aminopeptidase/acylaminoacyl peptidase